MQINHFLLLKKLKSTESAQLWAGTQPAGPPNGVSFLRDAAEKTWKIIASVKTDSCIIYQEKRNCLTGESTFEIVQAKMKEDCFPIS